MIEIEVITDKIITKHFSGNDFAERAKRVLNIIKALHSYSDLLVDVNVSKKYSFKDDYTLKIIKTVHSENLIELLQNTQYKEAKTLDYDNVTNNFTYTAAVTSAKLALIAAENSTVKKTIFSLSRPPGHHATTTKASGFCYFNNIAIGTKNMLLKRKKVAIIDFDNHYGNGTADIFWEDPNVLFISIHADPIHNYPNTGFVEEIGGGDGKGYNICIPLSFGSGNHELIASFYEIILPLLREFHPHIIGVSAGFDGYQDDPIGGGYLKYNKYGYRQLGEILRKYSLEQKIPVFHVLEGGYNIIALPELLKSYISPWFEDLFEKDIEYKSFQLTPPFNIKKKEQNTFSYIKKTLSAYWNLA